MGTSWNTFLEIPSEEDVECLLLHKSCEVQDLRILSFCTYVYTHECVRGFVSVEKWEKVQKMWKWKIEKQVRRDCEKKSEKEEWMSNRAKCWKKIREWKGKREKNKRKS